MWKSSSEEKIGKLQNFWRKSEKPKKLQGNGNAFSYSLHKKENKTNANNYKGIPLLPMTYKVLSEAILDRLKAQIDQPVSGYQEGFRKGRSYEEQIMILNFFSRKYCLRNKNIVIVFVDFRKAYDSVDMAKLFSILGIWRG